jgi:hypothetical protein
MSVARNSGRGALTNRFVVCADTADNVLVNARSVAVTTLVSRQRSHWVSWFIIQFHPVYTCIGTGSVGVLRDSRSFMTDYVAITPTSPTKDLMHAVGSRTNGNEIPRVRSTVADCRATPVQGQRFETIATQQLYRSPHPSGTCIPKIQLGK